MIKSTSVKHLFVEVDPGKKIPTGRMILGNDPVPEPGRPRPGRILERTYAHTNWFVEDLTAVRK